MSPLVLPNELRAAALAALCFTDVDDKCWAARQLVAVERPVDADALLAPTADVPGRPSRPRLVRPGQVARRDVATRAGRAALLHAVAHIEFNAIGLALDAVWRFSGMPEHYYRDWAHVASEEAHHFTLLRERLRDAGHDYGDFDGHDGLWETARKTSDDVLARMALVPRLLEARGLDASPQVRDKLARAGDDASAAVIDLILRDEIGHVAIGNRWYRALCAQRGLDPVSTFATLVRERAAPRLRGPFNLAARRAAGFDEAELAALTAAQAAGEAA